GGRRRPRWQAIARRAQRKRCPPARSGRGHSYDVEASAVRQAVDQEARRVARSESALLRTDRAANSVLSLSPFGERVGVRGSETHRETLTPHPTPLPMGEEQTEFAVSRSLDQRHPGEVVSAAIMTRAYGTVSSNVARKGCAG